MIDDSLVRGTTAGPLVKLLRDAGATEVHLRITCPPITHACHFGVDMGHDGDLMAARPDRRGDARAHRCRLARVPVARRDDAGDHVDPATKAGDADGYCNACFTGRYPMEVAEAQAKLSLRGRAGVNVRRCGRLMRVWSSVRRTRSGHRLGVPAARSRRARSRAELGDTVGR